jgi:predicted  nucleic acid-binding Zn ribbon protein
MDDENDDLIPQKQSLFPMTADDIVDNALQNLDEQQAR